MIDRFCRGKARPASPRPAHATPDLGHRSERRQLRSRLARRSQPRVRRPSACSIDARRRARVAAGERTLRHRRPGPVAPDLGDRSLLTAALCCCCRLASRASSIDRWTSNGTIAARRGVVLLPPPCLTSIIDRSLDVRRPDGKPPYSGDQQPTEHRCLPRRPTPLACIRNPIAPPYISLNSAGHYSIVG